MRLCLLMLSTATRLRLKDILERISRNEEVTLNERVFLHKFADRDQTVSSWLNKARRLQQHQQPKDAIENLLNELNIGSPEPDSSYDPDKDDLGDWFGGAPSWLGRS